MPIEHGDDGLQIEQDDAGPSRRAEQEAKPAFAGSGTHREDHGRVHGASRALAGLDAVRDGTSLVIDGDEGEIGELIVEQKPAHHRAVAEGLLDGGGHGHGVAVVIDDGDMARADALKRRVVTIGALARVGRRAAVGLTERAVRIDQRAALIEIGAVEQAGDGAVTKSGSAR